MALPKVVSTYVFDTWALLEWLQLHQPATNAVDQLLDLKLRGEASLLMSRLNYGEVYYSCWKAFPQSAASFVAEIEALPIDLISVDNCLIEEAARLKVVNSASYADCFAAALALRYQVPVVTGDPEFLKMASTTSLQVHWLGP